LDLDCGPHHALQRPALAPALRARFDDVDQIARFGFVVLVMHHEGRGAPFALAVQPVPDLPLDGNDDALLHLVADDDSAFFCFLRHGDLWRLTRVSAGAPFSPARDPGGRCASCWGFRADPSISESASERADP